MLNVSVTFQPKSKLRLTDFSGGFTDWKCGVPNKYFTEIENWEVLDNRTIHSRYGSRVFDISNPAVPNETRIERMDCLKGNILYFSGKNIAASIGGGFVNISGPEDSDLMAKATDITCSDSAFWQDHIYVVDDAFSKPTKLFCDKFGNLTAVTAGLPKMVTPPTATSSIDEGANYAYAFVYCYEYNVGNTTFTDFSEPTLIQISDGPDFDTLGEQVTLDNIPTLVSDPGCNYDAGRVSIKVYRTTNGGTTFYELGTVNNGTTIFSDGQKDSTIETNPVIFNQDSSITYDQPPPSKFIEITGDVAWYAHSQVGGVVYPNRVYQSLPADPDTVPGDFFTEFDGTVNGLASYDIYPIVSVVSNEGDCTLYRIEGVLDDQGRNILQKRVISETVSSVNNNSFVKGKKGLYFFGTDGVHRTDGIKSVLLSETWHETYCDITETDVQKKNVYGTYDKERGIVYWAITSNAGLDENDKILVFKEKSNTFHWWSNGDCLKSDSLIIKDKGELIRGNYDGYVMIHTEDTYSDTVIDPTKDVSEWSRKHIPFCLRSIDIDAGDCDTFKKFEKIHIKGKPDTDVTALTNSYDNGCRQGKPLKGFTHKASAGWCTDEDGWCTNPNGWLAGDDCYMDQVRTFPCGGRRAKTKCIEIKCDIKTLDCSTSGDLDSYIRVNEFTGYIFRENGVPFDPTTDIGNTITINQFEYPIVDVVSGTAIVDYQGTQPTAGLYPYEHKGYPLNERIHLSCITLTYSQEGGENAYCAPESKAQTGSEG